MMQCGKSLSGCMYKTKRVAKDSSDWGGGGQASLQEQETKLSFVQSRMELSKEGNLGLGLS